LFFPVLTSHDLCVQLQYGLHRIVSGMNERLEPMVTHDVVRLHSERFDNRQTAWHADCSDSIHNSTRRTTNFRHERCISEDVVVPYLGNGESTDKIIIRHRTHFSINTVHRNSVKWTSSTLPCVLFHHITGILSPTHVFIWHVPPLLLSPMTTLRGPPALFSDFRSAKIQNE
jgi:hypothetical protein